MTENLELTFACKEDSLSVRRFSVRESLSGLFQIEVIARSPVPDLDLEKFVGHGATFRILGDARDATKLRVWTGVCSQMQEVQAEETGLSTYHITISPLLWRTQLRDNCRIYERMTLPDIVVALLAEWEIEPELRLKSEYVKHEYRVQYMETDFAFISRLLEEAGISYFFKFEETETKLVLSDDVGNGPARPGGPLPFVEGHTHEGRRDFVTQVKVMTEVRTGRAKLRDYDFRLRADYQLYQEHEQGIDRETKLETFRYLPGSFWVETRGAALPFADDKGLYKADEQHGKQRAKLALESLRTGRRMVIFDTNAVDLAPGLSFLIEQHPRADVGEKLIVSSMSLAGNHDGDYDFAVEAVFASDPIRPVQRTPRPRISGVQSAMVVGPPGEEIHTDEFGRVRLQFHWDREHSYTDESSCWVRVSQGWAGLGYGMICLPRVGQEVLVEFFDGDPDRPVVTGRVYNSTTRVPYSLPENKTKSGWRSDSSPGSNGFNELMFEDKKGRELVHIQAEKDFTEVIKNNQSSTVLSNRSASVTSNDSVTVGASHSVNVGDSEARVVKRALTVDVGELHAIHVASGTGTEIRDRSIVSSTGGAMIILDGDDIIIQAKGSITLVADRVAGVHGGQEVHIEGGNTFINCSQPAQSNTFPFAEAKDPAGPGSGGATNDSRLTLSGQNEVPPPGSIDLAVPNAFVPRPARDAATAPDRLAIDGGAAAAIRQAVQAASPVEAARALVGGLGLGHLDRAMTVIDAVKRLSETRGLSLLDIPELQGAVGSLVTSPIVGDLSAQDLAQVVNLGKRFGVVHLSERAGAVVDAIAGASAPGADAASAAAGGAGAGAAPEGPLPGIKQLMMVRTDATPAALDPAALQRDIGAAGGGLGGMRAALANQGVALYTGDFAGNFNKIGI